MEIISIKKIKLEVNSGICFNQENNQVYKQNNKALAIARR